MRVLIVDEMHESIHGLLENSGLEVSYLPELNYEEASEIIHDFDGLLIRSKFFVDDFFLEKASSLKFIGRAGAGLDLIDLKACAEREIQVFAANEANRVAVAEQLLGMLLSLFHNIIKGNDEVKSGKWLREENRGEELYGKTVGIIGYGNNGSESAARFAAFGCEVLAYDKYKSGFGKEGITECSLEDIFMNADILSLHIPLTAETKDWVNADFFTQFRKEIYFCNVARGEIMNQTDLVSALRSGKVKGACLDVLANEKLSKLTDSQKEEFIWLNEHPRVIITPHVAGWTVQSYQRINEVLSQKIKDFIVKKEVNAGL